MVFFKRMDVNNCKIMGFGYGSAHYYINFGVIYDETNTE
jgi:hypothetical protein